MPVELGGVTLEHLVYINVQERARIARHPVPGMSGSLAQTMGRPSVIVTLQGILYGDTIVDELKQLRDVFLQHQPVDFFTEAVGEGYFAQVLISRLDIGQRAGYLDRFDFHCEVIEYVEPPQPAAIDSLSLLDSELLDEATGFMDDMQNALEQVAQLTDLIANAPNFGNPVEGLQHMLDDYTTVTTGTISALNELLNLF
jgi:hypothetical protein